MIKNIATLLALVFAFSIGPATFGQNSNSSTTMKSAGRAERNEARGEDMREGRKHRRHRHARRRHSSRNRNPNANH